MKSLNLNCPIGGSGYGISSLNIFKELTKLHNISLFPIGQNASVNSEEEKTLLQEAVRNNQNFSYNAPCLKIWHQNDLASRIGRGKYYAFPFFELDTITPLERHHLNYTDELFVASEWGKNVLINNGVDTKITVAPLGVDMNIFTEPPKIKVENDNYIFFHIGKWEKRKSQDFLIKAFETAFDVNDNVELWLMPFNPFISKEQENYWLNLVDNSKLSSKIKIYNRVETQYDLATFIYYADCGVFISRAEGWNNEAIECMAMNKPIITTFYSAHTEYCDEDNSYLVHVEDKEPAYDIKWFNGQGNWAKLADQELEQVVNHMRNVYTNKVRSNPEGVITAQKYNWTNTAKIISSTIFKEKHHANTKAKSRRR
jgi:glycosyltransferase involved in cell wall biosynthesis